MGMTAYAQRTYGAHLIGSVPLANAETVFRTVTVTLSPYLCRADAPASHPVKSHTPDPAAQLWLPPRSAPQESHRRASRRRRGCGRWRGQT